jgi:hypothetical protein
MVGLMACLCSCAGPQHAQSQPQPGCHWSGQAAAGRGGGGTGTCHPAGTAMPAHAAAHANLHTHPFSACRLLTCEAQGTGLHTTTCGSPTPHCCRPATILPARLAVAGPLCHLLLPAGLQSIAASTVPQERPCVVANSTLRKKRHNAQEKTYCTAPNSRTKFSRFFNVLELCDFC